MLWGAMWFSWSYLIGGQVVLTWNDSHGYWGSHFLQMEWLMINVIWCWYLNWIRISRCWRSSWCQIKFQSGGTMLIWRTSYGIKIGASIRGSQQPRCARGVLKFKTAQSSTGNLSCSCHYPHQPKNDHPLLEDNVSNKHNMKIYKVWHIIM